MMSSYSNDLCVLFYALQYGSFRPFSPTHHNSLEFNLNIFIEINVTLLLTATKHDDCLELCTTKIILPSPSFFLQIASS